MISHAKSQKIFAAARQVIPGGVNSPVRAYTAVGGDPIVLARGKGSHVWDVDGNAYLDYIGSWGPLILGHAPDNVVRAVTEAAESGTSFGALTEREVELAQLLCAALPCLEMVRMVNSGTEAVMSAIRLARAVTRRDYIIKFDGGYHGHSDGLLAKAGSGIATQGIPGTPGVPEAFAALTITIPFNDLNALREVLAARGHEIACLIGEPVPANMGVVLPEPGYWEEVRRLLDAHGSLLLFDEVITGFRLGWQGGQGWSGVTPDLCTLGKIIGGGLPAAAYGGRAEFMRRIAPEGPVYQAGTLSGNPLAVAAGLATLRELQRTLPYSSLASLTDELAEGLRQAASDAGVPVTVNHVASILTVFFTEGPVTDFHSAARSDTQRFAAFFHACLRHGVMLAPSQFEATFVSTAHTEAEIAQTIAGAHLAFQEVAS
jgi:glutamate-1-semialdehyde 2,1-aminomutase